MATHWQLGMVINTETIRPILFFFFCIQIIHNSFYTSKKQKTKQSWPKIVLSSPLFLVPIPSDARLDKPMVFLSLYDSRLYGPSLYDSPFMLTLIPILLWNKAVFFLLL